LLGIVFYNLYFIQFFEVRLSVDVLNVRMCMVRVTQNESCH